MLTAREEKLEKKREFQEIVNQVISWVKQSVTWSQWGRRALETPSRPLVQVMLQLECKGPKSRGIKQCVLGIH